MRELLEQALDALTRAKFELRGVTATQDIDEAVAALREALNAPEPEPVGTVYTMEALVPGGDVRCHATLHNALPAGTKLYAAPPAAPADDHATPSGGQEAGPQEDRIEAAYWRFDARHKGYSQWKTAPMSERDAFKAEMRNALESEKVRAEMRLVARGWRRPDAPAAPAPAAPVVPLTGGALGLEETHPSYVAGFKAGHAAGRERSGSAAPPAAPAPAAPVPDGCVMVPREPTPEMIAAMPYPANTIPAVGVACYRAMIAASPAAPAAPVVLQLWCPETGELCGTCSKTGTCEASMIQAHGIGGGNG